jgi:hypothetical protein
MSGSSTGSGKTSCTTFEALHPHLNQTIDNTFPLDLVSACVDSSILSMWNKNMFTWTGVCTFHDRDE